MEDVFRELGDLKLRRQRATLDLEVQLMLKQGQDEVQLPARVTDYGDAVLLPRAAVESLNLHIRTLGKAKVEFLTEIKDFKKGIHLLEWENTKADMDAADLVAKTRDVQLLRVTKNLQELIKGGDDERLAQEVAAIERRMEHSAMSHERKLADRKKSVSKIKRAVRKKVDETDALRDQLRDLELAVAERSRIHGVQTLHHNEHGPEQRLKDVAVRRKLVDLAKAQAEEIAALREEVERLRMRTFPAFAKVHGRR